MAIWDQSGTTFLDKHWCFFSYTLFPFDLRIYSTTNLTLRLSRWLAPTSIIGIYESFRRLLRTNPSGNFPSFYTNKHIPVYIPCMKDPTHNTNLLGLYSPFVHWCLHFLVFFACTRERRPWVIICIPNAPPNTQKSELKLKAVSAQWLLFISKSLYTFDDIWYRFSISRHRQLSLKTHFFLMHTCFKNNLDWNI